MPPQRGSVEFAASHVALHDAVSESGPMSWRAKSLNGENVTLLWFVKIDLPVACCGIWQRLQPTLVKTCLPTGRRGGRRSRSRSCGEAHEGCKIHNITGII